MAVAVLIWDNLKLNFCDDSWIKKSFLSHFEKQKWQEKGKTTLRSIFDKLKFVKILMSTQIPAFFCRAFVVQYYMYDEHKYQLETLGLYGRLIYVDNNMTVVFIQCSVVRKSNMCLSLGITTKVPLLLHKWVVVYHT